MGPEGGEGGGRVVAQGTPEQVARVKKSYTGQMLSRVLNVQGNGSVVSAAEAFSQAKTTAAPAAPASGSPDAFLSP